MEVGASVVIAAYNAEAFLADAIRSALDQTVPVEVIVVDDGSTDGTWQVAQSFGDAVRRISLPHGGPSKARNAGLESASAEFVMFLDADDVIAPRKVERQLREFEESPEAGWVLSDVLIIDYAKNVTETASKKYGYAQREMGGWLEKQLQAEPFIPIMSPLVRRSVFDPPGAPPVRFTNDRDTGLKFTLKQPEDWRFWYQLSKHGRARYVPEVLATYHHRKTGRSRLPDDARVAVPDITQPVRLNLGAGTLGSPSEHWLHGFVNKDKSHGWCYEDGLGDYPDGSVAAILISHSIMYVRIEDWPRMFAEFARVLEPGGIIRITEDDTEHPDSRRYRSLWNGSEPGVTYTGPALVREHLARVGLTPLDVTPATSHYRDQSLVHRWHGDPPHVFFMEGRRDSAVLFAPHCDDEVLWASFTMLKYRPHLVVCFKSARDYGPDDVRERETRDASEILGARSVEYWAGGDIEAQMQAYDARMRPARVWAPDRRTSHPEHLAVAVAAETVFGSRLTTYHTYDASGKVRAGQPVAFEPAWTEAKLRALTRHVSQIRHPRANQWFMNDLFEYYGTETA